MGRPFFNDCNSPAAMLISPHQKSFIYAHANCMPSISFVLFHISPTDLYKCHDVRAPNQNLFLSIKLETEKNRVRFGRLTSIWKRAQSKILYTCVKSVAHILMFSQNLCKKPLRMCNTCVWYALHNILVPTFSFAQSLFPSRTWIAGQKLRLPSSICEWLKFRVEK